MAKALVLVAGCSTLWVRPPDRTEADFKRDFYECRRDALMLPRTPQSVTLGAYGYPTYADPTLGWGDIALQQSMMKQCLESKGYRRQ